MGPLIVETQVEVGGLFDHLPILLGLQEQEQKPASPFKFNPSWLQEEEYQKLVAETWVPLADNPNVSFMKQFAGNELRTKKETKKWEKIFNDKRKIQLKEVEA